MTAINRAKEDSLTHECLTTILQYDPLTGIFTWKVTMSASAVIGSMAGRVSQGYIRIRINKKDYYAHRLAWFYIYGKWPEQHIDHIDRNKQNNAITNLRDVTQSTNQHNRDLSKNNTSGIKGVCYSQRDQAWKAYIKVDNKMIHLGYFGDLNSAIQARLKGESKYLTEKLA